jgi:ABC-type uncharacterized transport system involved in gliding motility auxiliary subunit
MKAAYIILPFLAILVSAIMSAVGSAFADMVWIKYIGWAIGLLIMCLWIYLDLENFKSRFSKNGMKYGAGSGLVVILVMIALVAFGNLTNRARFNKQVDLTRGALNTLTGDSEKLLKRLAAENVSIKVEAFFQDDVIQDTFKSILGLYKQFGTNIEAEYIDPRMSPDRAISAKITSPNTAVFKYQNREASVTNFTEEKITNALLSVSKEGSKKIYFLTGHGEPVTRGEEGESFGLATTILEGQKFGVSELSLLEEASVPSDADLVVFAGPKYDLKEAEVKILESYLSGGGALLVAVDAVVSIPRTNELLNKFNLNIENDLLILSPNDIRAQMFGQNFTIINDFDDMSGVTKDLAGKGNELMVPFVRTVSTLDKNKDLHSLVAAKTSDVMVKIADVEKEEDLKNLSEDRMESGSFGVLGVSSGGSDDTGANSKNTRLVAFGSSHFMNNQGMQLSAANTDLLGGIISYLTRDKDFISIPSKKMESGSIDLSSGTSQLVLLLISFIYPFVFLGGGVVYWLRRRAL